MLAIALEQTRRLTSRRLLDRGIAIDERQAEPLGQAPADGRFAGAHQPDEDDRTIEVGQLLHFSGTIWRGYTDSLKVGQKPFAYPFLLKRSAMPRGLIFLILIILIIVGGIFFLSNSAEEVPVQTIESDVTANAAN